MIDQILAVLIIAVILVDLYFLRRSLFETRKKLLEYAGSYSKTQNSIQVKVECDNADFLIKMAQVRESIDSALAAMRDLEGLKMSGDANQH
jgi:hypothetical protein